MLITYHRTGGRLAMFIVGALAFASTVMTLVIAAAMFVIGLLVAGGLLVASLVLPRGPRSFGTAGAPWSGGTIEGAVIDTASSSGQVNRTP